ncbi:MAG TPA: hypothetical protein VFB81_11765 [Myxococcales bacterium]|nr:hypothetical protein [Myxococcales bacterium]
MNSRRAAARSIAVGLILAVCGCATGEPDPEGGPGDPNPISQGPGPGSGSCSGGSFLCCEQGCTSGVSYQSTCSAGAYACKAGDVAASACPGREAGQCGAAPECPAANYYSYPGCPDGNLYNPGYPNWDVVSCAWRSIFARYPKCDAAGPDCIDVKFNLNCSGIPMCGYPVLIQAGSADAFKAEAQAELDKYCKCADFSFVFLC